MVHIYKLKWFVGRKWNIEIIPFQVKVFKTQSRSKFQRASTKLLYSEIWGPDFLKFEIKVSCRFKSMFSIPSWLGLRSRIVLNVLFCTYTELFYLLRKFYRVKLFLKFSTVYGYEFEKISRVEFLVLNLLNTIPYGLRLTPYSVWGPYAPHSWVYPEAILWFKL